jgi:hypothetical protein
MLTRIAFEIAVVLTTASGVLAATKTQALAPALSQNVYNPYGADLGVERAPGIHFELTRDCDRARGN